MVDRRQHPHRARRGELPAHRLASNLYRPNRADQINPAIPDEQWVQLNNLWAPSKVAAPFAYRPHNVQHVDPATGQVSKIVAVPAARYEGNEDGRGGFGALQYEQVMDQYRQFNTDPDHPMFVLLHHDGDNFGGGSEAYYHGNFNNMVNWASNNSELRRHDRPGLPRPLPGDQNDVVHIESGSWAGADNGRPRVQEVARRSRSRRPAGAPTATVGPCSPRRRTTSSPPTTSLRRRTSTTSSTASASLDRARLAHALAGRGVGPLVLGRHRGVGQQRHAWARTRRSRHADAVINATSAGQATAPSVFLPQRESYNPGGEEFGSAAAKRLRGVDLRVRRERP